jgi:hypothetical protein
MLHRPKQHDLRPRCLTDQRTAADIHDGTIDGGTVGSQGELYECDGSNHMLMWSQVGSARRLPPTAVKAFAIPALREGLAPPFRSAKQRRPLVCVRLVALAHLQQQHISLHMQPAACV